jgi:hypothetical protein
MRRAARDAWLREDVVTGVSGVKIKAKLPKFKAAMENAEPEPMRRPRSSRESWLYLR